MKRSIAPGIITTVLIILANLTIGAQISVPLDEGRSYLIGPGDEITVKVFGEPQFDFVATVDDDGRLEVPFVDTRVDAKCRSEKQLSAGVASAMSKYLRNPKVNLRVSERKSRPPTSVVGEVRQPQGVILVRETRLRELLAFVGGQTEDAGGMVQIYRGKAPVCSTDTVAYDGSLPYRLYSIGALNSGNEEANPLVYPGDVVAVQKAAPIYITGEVRQPMGIRLTEGGTSLTQAIAMVGGMNREAKTSAVRVYRLKADKSSREILTADLKMIKAGTQKDIMLEPYDIVEVDKAKKNIGETILELALGAGKSVMGSVTGGVGYRVLY